MALSGLQSYQWWLWFYLYSSLIVVFACVLIIKGLITLQTKILVLLIGKSLDWLSHAQQFT